MKKAILLILAAVMSLPTGLSAAQRFTVSLAAGVQWSSDSGYRDVYGRSVFQPKVQAGYSLSQDFYLWVGYGRVGAKGQTVELQSTAESVQNNLLLGAGYQRALSEKFGVRAELGLADVLYREKALGETVSGSALGFFLSGGLTFSLGGGFFALAEAGYLTAKKTINSVVVKMGGLEAGLGAGLRF